MTRVFVALGSNLDGPAQQLRTALNELARLPLTRLIAQSPLYVSDPMGPPDQPDYINAVAELDTALSAPDLLRELQALEHAHGRVRNGERWGPRVLDLDLLLFGQEQIHSDALTVPHPGIAERVFVLIPLHKIAPDLDVPGVGPVARLLAQVSPGQLHVFSD
jgi:2-amino-4-hydroxy-6-hydroxymethyldihydropteridine diphosphokinase